MNRQGAGLKFSDRTGLTPSQPLAFDDEPLEAILYGVPSRGPSSADRFAAIRPLIKTVRAAVASGQEEDALHQLQDLYDRGVDIPEGAAYEFAQLVARFIPDCPNPVVIEHGVPYDAILRPMFERALTQRNDALAELAGERLYRWYEGSGRYGHARAVLSVLLTHVQARGRTLAEAVYSNNLGYEHLLEGDWEQAEPWFVRALELFGRQQIVGEMLNARANIIVCRFGRLGIPAACVLKKEIAAVLRDLARRHEWRERKGLLMLARIAEARGYLRRAERLVRRAVRCALRVRTRHLPEDEQYLSLLQQRRAGAPATAPTAAMQGDVTPRSAA